MPRDLRRIGGSRGLRAELGGEHHQEHVREERHRVDAVRQRAHVRTSRARGERARLERVRHVADEDRDRCRWQHLAVEEPGREPEDGAAERIDQQQLNEIVEGEAEEPVEVPSDDPTHTHMLLSRYHARLARPSDLTTRTRPLPC